MGALDVDRSGKLDSAIALFSDARLGFEVSRVENIKQNQKFDEPQAVPGLEVKGIQGARMNTNKPGMMASITLSGIASVIAVNFIHPIELVKTRIQVCYTHRFCYACVCVVCY